VKLPSRDLPRSLLPLSVLLMVALAVWWFTRDAGDRTRLDAGGPLLPPAWVDVAEITLAYPGMASVLRRTPEGWLLSGPWSDWADSSFVERFIQDLHEELTSSVVPGTNGQTQLGRYGQRGGRGFELTLADHDGRSIGFSVGRLNPISGRAYAIGAQRSGVFTISRELAERLLTLPEEVRLRHLWPPFALAEVETITLRRPPVETADVYVRDRAGRWWWREPADGPMMSSPLARVYDDFYGDRRREEDGRRWRRASDRWLENLLFLLRETGVRKFGMLQAEADTLRALGLQPPTVSVQLAVSGRNRPYRAVFGQELPKGRMTALREGFANVLIVTSDARDLLLSPPLKFLEMGALPFRLARADSFEIRRDQSGPLRACRRGDRWRLVTPTDGAAPSEGQQAENLLADLVVHLDRLQIEQALPPQPGGSALAAGHRVDVMVWLSDPSPARVESLQIGLLPGTSEAAAYFPGDGKLLKVSSQILVTLRSMFIALGLARQ
jgi:hypothetical protein